MRLESLTSLSIVIMVLFSLIGCEQNTERQAAAEWMQAPVKKGSQELRFRLSADSQPLTQAQITVEANMNHPGMIPVYGKALEYKPGFYSVKLNLQMAGDWVFFIESSGAQKKFKTSLSSRVKP